MLDQKEEIKSKLDVVDVIRDYIQLSKAGVNYKARCPFHNEKTPSLVVSPEKQIWHCFGCGEGGDIFTFVMKMDNVDFPEAMRVLAAKAGVEIKKTNFKIDEHRRRLFSMNQRATAFFEENLFKTEEGKKAFNYLVRRGISENSISEFHIGFSPVEWDKLSLKMSASGFRENECVEVGLSLPRKNKKGIYDRFRGRIMFPIFDSHGDTVGFGGREFVKSDSKFEGPKYVNTPTTPIYNKSAVLYGLDKAKNYIRKYDFAIIVEGYTDVIMSHQADVKNTVSVSGTALTVEQIDLIKRYTNNLVLAFDMDLAGDKATRRGIEIALLAGMNVKVVSASDMGKDPADIIKESSKRWLAILKVKKSVGDFIIDSVLAKINPKDIVEKKKATAEILKFLSFMSDKIEQDHYIKSLSEKLDTEEFIIRDLLNTVTNDKSLLRYARPEAKTPIKIAHQKDRMLGRKNKLETRILALLLTFPELANLVEEEKIKLLPESYIGLYENLKEFYNRTGQFDLNAFKEVVANQDKKLADMLSELVLVIENEGISEDQSESEIKRCLGELYIYHLRRWLKDKEGELRVVEARGNDQRAEEIRVEISKLMELLQKQMADFR